MTAAKKEEIFVLGGQRACEISFLQAKKKMKKECTHELI